MYYMVLRFNFPAFSFKQEMLALETLQKHILMVAVEAEIG